MMTAILLTSTSCRNTKQQQKEEKQQDTIQTNNVSPLDSILKYDYKPSNEIAFSLFEKVNQSKKSNENFTISPLSLTNALVMLANGADGNTFKQITNVLGIKDMSAENISKMYSALNKYLIYVDPHTTFSNGNSIWINSKYQVKSDFISKNKNLFDAEVHNQPLATEKTRNDINFWSEKNTRGFIKEILYNPPASDSKMMLMNVLYFNGTWVYPFQKDATKEEDFTNYDGSKSKVKMMQQTQELKAYIGPKVDIVEFPYGNRVFSMVVFLPHKGEKIETCLKDINSKMVNNIDIYSDIITVCVKMPRIDLKCETNFNDCLKALGMKDAFSSNANFTKISSNNDLYVSEINQATFIKVTEEGTKAAAETDEVLRAKEIVETKEFEFNMNRPFAYIIREKVSGTILFMGKVRKL